MVAFALSYAQSSSPVIGAQAMGMGNSSACLLNEWAINNNIAGLTETSALTTAVSYHIYPTFKPFNRSAVMLATPAFNGVMGASAYKFGDNIYNEQMVSVGFANRLGLASLGVRVNYVQYQAEDFGSAGAFAITFGGIARLTPKFSVGSFITNINQSTLKADGGREPLPTRMYFGMAFKPTDKTYLTTEVEKDLDNGALFKGGLEYKFNNKFGARTGFNINPNAAFLGASFEARTLKFDYAMQYHLETGVNHQVSLRYQRKRK